MCRHAQDTLLLIACADRKGGRGHRHVLPLKLLRSSHVLAPMTTCLKPFTNICAGGPVRDICQPHRATSLHWGRVCRRRGWCVVCGRATSLLQTQPRCAGRSASESFSSTRRYTDGGAQWEAPEAAREGGHHAEGVRSRKFWGKRLSSRDYFGMWNLTRTAAYTCCGLFRTFAM